MKKFLSLVLALVMTMSLVTISAGAEFTDDSDVDYKAAVDVISAMGIVGGYSDGSFRPEGTLTRGAAAKIICIMTLGEDTAAALPTNVASYTDVPAGSTYAPYVAYLKSAGMISGFADGTFKPADKLTGFAFLKMLLGALGYDQTVEGYVGSGWQIKVAKQAKELKLYDDNKSFNGNALATRQEACLYALKALQTRPVEYVNGSTVTINGIAITTGADRQPDANYTYLWEKGFEDVVIDEDATDTVGRPATHYGYDKKDVGTYAESPKKVYTKSGLKEKTLYTDLGLDEATDFHLFADGANTEDADDAGYYQIVSIAKGVDTKIDQNYNVNGMVLEFYKSAKQIIALTPKVLQVTDVTEADEDTDTKRSITLDGTYTFETEDFAEDDMVLCFTNDYSNEASNVKAAEKLTGKVTKISGSDIWVDGTKYTKSATTWATANIDDPAVKDEVEFYLDDAGYIVKMDAASTATSTENVAFVEKVGKQTSGDYDGTNTYKATLRYADGTKEIVVLKDGKQTVTPSNPYLNKIVTYKTSSSKIVLANGDSDKLYNYSNASFTKGQPKIHTVTYGDFAVTASTKFVYVENVGTDDEAVATYTGFKNAPDFAAENDMGLLVDKDGKAVLVFVYADFVSAASETASYIIYNSDLKEIADEDIDGYYEAVMIENGEAKTVKVETDVWTGKIAAAAGTNGTSVAVLDSYTVSSKGAIDDVTATSYPSHKNVEAAADVTYKKGDEIVTIGGSTYTYDENTVVYKVNADKDEVTTTTIEKVANNTNASKVYESIALSITEKNALKLDVVFLFAK